MSLFGLSKEKEDKVVISRRNEPDGNVGLNGESVTKNPVQIRRPQSFAEVEEIIDNLCANKTVIVYLNEVADDTKRRVLDILSGADYALHGGIAEIEKDCYLITPAGVNNPYAK